MDTPPKKPRGPQIKVNAMSYAKLVRALYATSFAPRGITKNELAELTGLHIWTARGYVDALHKEEVIHIIGWEKDSLGRDATAIYVWGMGVDVPRAAKSGAQKARERRARAKAEKLAAERATVRVGILKNFDED